MHSRDTICLLSFRESGILVHAKRVPTYQSSTKTVGTGSLMGNLAHGLHFCCRQKSVFSAVPQERCTAYTWILWDSSCVCAHYIAVMNLCCESNYTLHPMNPSNESLSLEGWSKEPSTKYHILSFKTCKAIPYIVSRHIGMKKMHRNNNKSNSNCWECRK